MRSAEQEKVQWKMNRDGMWGTEQLQFYNRTIKKFTCQGKIHIVVVLIRRERDHMHEDISYMQSQVRRA